MIKKIIPSSVTGQLIAVIIFSMLGLHLGQQLEAFIEDYQEERIIDGDLINHLSDIKNMIKDIDIEYIPTFLEMVDRGYLYYAISEAPLVEASNLNELVDAAERLNTEIKAEDNEVIIGKT